VVSGGKTALLSVNQKVFVLRGDPERQKGPIHAALWCFPTVARHFLGLTESQAFRNSSTPSLI
jgi:hypothetical protein